MQKLYTVMQGTEMKGKNRKKKVTRLKTYDTNPKM